MRTLFVLFTTFVLGCSAGGEASDPMAVFDASGLGSDSARSPDGATGDPADPDNLPDPSSYRYLCDLDPPTGAPRPTLPIFSGGAGQCPSLFHFDGVDKQARNSIMSDGVERKFILVAPVDVVPGGEQLPVVVLWHHLGSDPDTFLKDGYLQNGVNAERFLAILPEAKGDLTFPIAGIEPEWPWMSDASEARIDEELTFFDDMIACVAERYGMAEHCISNGGVSAGGMWNAIVASRRSELLASTISISGGIEGPSWAGDMGREWSPAARKLPALVVWGGEDDKCITVDFQASSLALESELANDGHFIVECVHNCGHGVPPFEDSEGALAASPLWQYFLDHPYWLTAGNSPYRWSGMPSQFPAWCGVGAGSATVRTGMCDAPACPL